LYAGYFYNEVNFSRNVTVTNSYGGYFVGLFGRTQASGGTAATNVYGVYVADSQANSLTNNWGIYVELMDGGTNNYGIFLAGDGVGADLVMGADTGGDVSFRFGGTNTELVNIASTGIFDIQMAVQADSIHLDADIAGLASTNTITGVTDTPTTDPGWATSSSVDMNAPDGYIKGYNGTQAITIPFWNT